MAALKLQYLRISVLHPSKTRFLARTLTTAGSVADIPLNEEAKVPKKHPHYDFIIAGGGLVGTTLVCAIGKSKVLSDKKVLLLEGAPPFKGFNGMNPYSNRVSALNHGTANLMQTIGAWDLITTERYKPVRQMQVWDASSDAVITFNDEQFNQDIAYIVENDLVLHSVYELLSNMQNVEIRNSARIEKVLLPRDGVAKSTVFLKEGDAFTCELLVGADGANSLVRQQMDVNYFNMQYNQMGLVATLELCDAGDNSVAWQRFIPTGPVALLPLNNTMSSLVWSTSKEHAKELLSMEPEQFVDALNQAFVREFPQSSFVSNSLDFVDTVLGTSSRGARQLPPRVKSVIDKSRACFPLGFGHASSYVNQGVALIGDAAHRIHPLAGQGVNLGFGDVKCLIEVLSEAAYSGFKLGDQNNLLKYEQERLRKNVPIMLGVHGIQNIYNTTFTPVVFLRSLGLQLTQNIPPLKNLFMKRAMG